MRSLKRHDGWKRRLFYSKLSAGVFFLLVLFMGTVVWDMYGKFRLTEEKALAAEARLEEAKERKKDLKTKVDRLQTEQGVEAELRQKFLIAKEGEEVLVIVDENKEQDEEGTREEKEKSWWEKFLSIF